MRPGLRVDELGQGVGVGRLELGHLPVVEDLPGQGMDEGQLLEDIERRREALGDLGPAAGLQAELMKKDVGELAGGIDVEGASGGAVDLLFEAPELPFELLGHRLEDRGVDPDPQDLHPGQQADEGLFDLLVKPVELPRPDLVRQDLAELLGEGRVLAGVGGRRLDGHLVHGQLLLALAGDVRVRRLRLPEIVEGQLLEPVLAPVRLEKVGQDHRVPRDPGQPDALPLEDDQVVLDVLAGLQDLRVLKDGAEDVQGPLLGDLGRGARGNRGRPGHRTLRPGRARTTGRRGGPASGPGRSSRYRPPPGPPRRSA